MPHYPTTDDVIESILRVIATGSKVQVVGSSESTRDVDPSVTRLLRHGQGRDAGCMFWDGAPADVMVRVEMKEGTPRLNIVGVGNPRTIGGFMEFNKVYDEVMWRIDCCDAPERDAIRSKRLDVHVPPALAAMSVNELSRLIFAAVKKAATGY